MLHRARRAVLRHVQRSPFERKTQLWAIAPPLTALSTLRLTRRQPTVCQHYRGTIIAAADTLSGQVHNTVLPTLALCRTTRQGQLCVLSSDPSLLCFAAREAETPLSGADVRSRTNPAAQSTMHRSRTHGATDTSDVSATSHCPQLQTALLTCATHHQTKVLLIRTHCWLRRTSPSTKRPHRNAFSARGR